MDIAKHSAEPERIREKLEEKWPRLYRIAYSWNHDPHLSADLVQETLVKALKKPRRLDGVDALDKWLIRILVNCWHDHWRRQKPTLDVYELTLASESSPERDHETRQVIDQVRAAVAALGPDQREVVTLVDLEGMSYREVGEVLDIPVGTVQSRLFRARQQLETTLKDLAATSAGVMACLRRVK